MGSLVPYPEPHPDHVAALVQENLPILEADWTPTFYDLTIAQLVQLSGQGATTAAQRSANPVLIVWPESPAQARNASKDVPPPPIVELLKKKPWLLASLYSGRIPHDLRP